MLDIRLDNRTGKNAAVPCWRSFVYILPRRQNMHAVIYSSDGIYLESQVTYEKKIKSVFYDRFCADHYGDSNCGVDCI